MSTDLLKIYTNYIINILRYISLHDLLFIDQNLLHYLYENKFKLARGSFKLNTFYSGKN